MLAQRLQLNRLFFELIEVQAKIAYYDNKGWSPRKLYLRIEELETQIQELTTQLAGYMRASKTQPRDALGRFRSIKP